MAGCFGPSGDQPYAAGRYPAAVQAISVLFPGDKSAGFNGHRVVQINGVAPFLEFAILTNILNYKIVHPLI